MQQIDYKELANKFAVLTQRQTNPLQIKIDDTKKSYLDLVASCARDLADAQQVVIDKHQLIANKHKQNGSSKAVITKARAAFESELAKCHDTIKHSLHAARLKYYKALESYNYSLLTTTDKEMYKQGVARLTQLDTAEQRQAYITQHGPYFARVQSPDFKVRFIHRSVG